MTTANQIREMMSILEEIGNFDGLIDAITNKIQEVTGYDDDCIINRGDTACRWAVPDEDDEIQIEVMQTKSGEPHLEITHTNSKKNKAINQYSVFPDNQSVVDTIGKSLFKFF